MRQFASPGFTLRQAPRRLRLVYAAFLLLTAIGLTTQIGFQVGRIGVTPRAIARYYRGDETGEVMAFPKTFGQLLEVTHAHAFVMALIFLVLAHLVAATPMPSGCQHAVVAITFAGLIGDLIAPWLTRYVAAPWAWLALVAWALQGAGLAVMVAVSGWECSIGDR